MCRASTLPAGGRGHAGAMAKVASWSGSAPASAGACSSPAGCSCCGSRCGLTRVAADLTRNPILCLRSASMPLAAASAAAASVIGRARPGAPRDALSCLLSGTPRPAAARSASPSHCLPSAGSSDWPASCGGAATSSSASRANLTLCASARRRRASSRFIGVACGARVSHDPSPRSRQQPSPGRASAAPTRRRAPHVSAGARALCWARRRYAPRGGQSDWPAAQSVPR